MKFVGATSGDLANGLSETLGEPIRTVRFYGDRLRAADLLTVKGHGRGAARMTAEDAAAWLVALCIDHERGGDFAREVTRALSLPRHHVTIVPEDLETPWKFASSKTAGEAIAALFVDVFDPAIIARIEDEGALNLAFDATGEGMSVMFVRHGEHEVYRGGLWTFQRAGYQKKHRARSVNKTISVHGRVFLKIGRLLGLEPPLLI